MRQRSSGRAPGRGRLVTRHPDRRGTGRRRSFLVCAAIGLVALLVPTLVAAAPTPVGSPAGRRAAEGDQGARGRRWWLDGPVGAPEALRADVALEHAHPAGRPLHADGDVRRRSGVDDQREELEPGLRGQADRPDPDLQRGAAEHHARVPGAGTGRSDTGRQQGPQPDHRRPRREPRVGLLPGRADGAHHLPGRGLRGHRPRRHRLRLLPARRWRPGPGRGEGKRCELAGRPGDRREPGHRRHRPRAGHPRRQRRPLPRLRATRRGVRRRRSVHLPGNAADGDPPRHPSWHGRATRAVAARRHDLRRPERPTAGSCSTATPASTSSPTPGRCPSRPWHRSASTGCPAGSDLSKIVPLLQIVG